MSKSPTIDDDPKSALGASALQCLEKNACFLLYPVMGVDVESVGALTLSQLAVFQKNMGEDGKRKNDAWICPDVFETITEDRGSRRVWEDTQIVLGNDLYQHVKRLLGGAGVTEDNIDSSALNRDHPSVFRLSDSAGKLIGGRRLAYGRETPKQDRLPKRLVVNISKAAQARIARRHPRYDYTFIEFDVSDVQYVSFRTGYALLVVEIEFLEADQAGVDPYLIVEGIYSLSRFNRCSWRANSYATDDEASEFTFGSMIHSLVGHKSHRTIADRVFTATCLVWKGKPDPFELDKLMVQLGRHYTDDYKVHSGAGGIEFVRNFKNVTHVFCLEGASTAVSLGDYADGKAPEFLRNYLSNTFKSHYLPILMLAYHKYWFLVNATTNASIWAKSGEEKENIEHLRQVREKLTNFMLCFRFTYVSHISMHNDVNQALENSLGLDRLLTELHDDTSIMDAHLLRVAADIKSAIQSRNERRFHWVSVAAVFGISWYTSFNIFKRVLGIEFFQNMFRIVDVHVELTAACIGVVIGVIAASIANIKRGGKN